MHGLEKSHERTVRSPLMYGHADGFEYVALCPHVIRQISQKPLQGFLLHTLHTHELSLGFACGCSCGYPMDAHFRRAQPQQNTPTQNAAKAVLVVK